MDNTRRVAEYIHDDFINRAFNEKDEKLQRTARLIDYFVTDIIKVINDISKTSLSEDDANKRLAELEKQCGIKINLKLKI